MDHAPLAQTRPGTSDGQRAPDGGHAAPQVDVPHDEHVEAVGVEARVPVLVSRSVHRQRVVFKAVDLDHERLGGVDRIDATDEVLTPDPTLEVETFRSRAPVCQDDVRQPW